LTEEKDAKRDLGEARAAARDARAKWGPVRELTDRLHKLRESNHFSEMIASAFRGKV